MTAPNPGGNTRGPAGAHLQRVPPHDDRTEANLLGAALNGYGGADAARSVAALGATPFYRPAHQTIAETITNLVQQGLPCDAGTVAAHLHQAGQVDAIGGVATLTTMMANTESLGAASVAHWAELIADHHARRRILNAAAEVVDAVYQGLPTAGLITAMHTEAVEHQLGAASSWEPVDLAGVLAGDTPDIVPTVWARSDGQHLLYPGKTHAINAESEAGKSWCMQHASTQEVREHHHVLYVDFEADAPDVVGRMLELGCTPAEVIEYFHYIRPDDPIGPDALLRVTAACQTWRPTLAVLDGVTEALASTGWSIKENDDIAQFLAALPRPLERQGCAVVMIDHLPKDRERQGRGGIGGEHKLAGITGANYKLESLTPFSRNNPGSSRLICDKDRHGQVRPNCKDQRLAAVIHFKPLPGGYGITIEADPYGDLPADDFRPTHLMGEISRVLAHGPAMRANQVVDDVRGARKNILAALRWLIADEYVVAVKQGQAIYHSNVRPYPDDSQTEDTGDNETF